MDSSKFCGSGKDECGGFTSQIGNSEGFRGQELCFKQVKIETLLYSKK